MYGKDVNDVSRPVLIDSSRRLVTAPIGGKYADAVLAGRVFVAANQAAVAVTAAFAKSYTGLVVANPAASGKNLIMLEFGYAADAAVPAATGIGLMTGMDAGDAAAAIAARNRLMGSSNTSVALPDDGCTLIGTPVLEQVFAAAWAEATTAGTLMPPNIVELDGSLIVTPGYYVAAYSTAGLTAAMLFHFMWER